MLAVFVNAGAVILGSLLGILLHNRLKEQHTKTIVACMGICTMVIGVTEAITTSNIMLQDDKLAFIDFGLGRYSHLDEDKAVDLLVLKKSLQSIDYNLAVKYFDCVLKGYDNEKMVNHISDIESRGRYTH